MGRKDGAEKTDRADLEEGESLFLQAAGCSILLDRSAGRMR